MSGACERYICSFDEEKENQNKNQCILRLWHFFDRMGREKKKGFLHFKFLFKCEN